MNTRLLALLGVAAVVMAAVVFMNLEAKPSAGDAAIQTAWGEPDLQGLWAQKYQIRLQRPARNAGKEALTDAEVAQREADREKQAATAPKRGERIAPRGTLERARPQTAAGQVLGGRNHHRRHHA